MRVIAWLVAFSCVACSDSTGSNGEPDRTVTTVSVSPAGPTVVAGATVQLSATPRNAAGETISGKTAAWTSQNQGIATVSNTGLARGVATGSTVVTATIDGKSGTTTISVTAPPPVELTSRVGHAMAYDEARQQVLLFGGTGTEGGGSRRDLASLWAWNGTTWTRLAAGGPSPRNRASLVYDAARQRVVLYGGQTGSFPNITILRDTWEWNGTTWTQVTDAGPSQRIHQHLTYDRARARVILYGGFDPGSMTELRDIWEWSGTAWTQAPVSTPPGTIARGAAHDEKAATTFLYSIVSGSDVVAADRYNGTTVERVASANPPCVPALLSGLGATRGGILMYAPACGASQAAQSHVWNGSAWTIVAGALPTARFSSAMAYDRARDRVVLFGGEAQGVPDLADTWEFDGATWVRR